jgi:hypothetical protein
MRTLKKSIFTLICAALSLICFHSASGQKAMSFSHAYSSLNGSSGSPNNNANTGQVVSSGTKSTINYGIPWEIATEWNYISNGLRSGYSADPNTYNNSSVAVQQALTNLMFEPFHKISDYTRGNNGQVNVKLNFRYNPAALNVYGVESGFKANSIYDASSTPWDPGIYYYPTGAPSGYKIMIIK